MHKIFLVVTAIFTKYLKKYHKGYLLPVVFVLGLALTFLGIFGLTVVGNNSIETNNTIYGQLATEASKSGLAAAKSCLSSTSNVLWIGTLDPTASCLGAGSSSTILNDTTRKITTTFTVSYSPVVNGKTTLTSTGTVKVNGVVVATNYASTIVSATGGIPPTFTGISPASGGSGTTITVTGTNFVVGDTSVTVGGVAATATVNSTTSLTVTVPSIGTAGAKNVVISTSGGSATGTSVFTYYLLPTFTSISPVSGTTGTSTTITGSNFVSGGTSVTVGGVAATTTFVSTTQLTVTVPSIGTAGTKNVVISTLGGTATGTGVFSYSLPPTPPTCTSFSPTGGVGNTAVTITGTNFVSGSTSATVGGVAATTTVSSATSLTVYVPNASTSGNMSIVITAPGGSVTCPGTFAYDGPLSCTSFTPTSGTTGTSITVTGTNFIAGSMSTTVGGVAATTTVNSTTQLTVTIPSISTAGAKAIVINKPNWSAGCGNFTYNLPPTISSISPAEGITGKTVTIAGTNFVSGSTSVTVGGVAATTTVNSATSLTVTIPSIATEGVKSFSVTTTGGTATGGSYTYWFTYAPVTSTYSTSGQYTYTQPAWANRFDYVALGAGAGGETGGAGFRNGAGGGAGSWNVYTDGRRTGLTPGVGSGGLGGQSSCTAPAAGNRSYMYVNVAGTLYNIIEAMGGSINAVAAVAGSIGSTGQSASSYTYNGVSYPGGGGGGGGNSSNGGNGGPGAGGGGGGGFLLGGCTAGGNGGAGRVYVKAYQSY